MDALKAASQLFDEAWHFGGAASLFYGGGISGNHRLGLAQYNKIRPDASMLILSVRATISAPRLHSRFPLKVLCCEGC